MRNIKLFATLVVVGIIMVIVAHNVGNKTRDGAQYTSFAWDKTADATGYEVCVTTETTQCAPGKWLWTEETSIQFRREAGQRYYLWVRAVNGLGASPAALMILFPNGTTRYAGAGFVDARMVQ